MIDGCATNMNVDSTSESLDISGLDISSLLSGTGVINYEHSSKSPSDILGKITYSKKIFSSDDCESERELYWWNKIDSPMLYIQAELFDGVGHRQASELASIMRYDAEQREMGEKVPNVVSFSVEGSVLDKTPDSGVKTITSSIARAVTVTIKPANKSAEAEIMPKTMKEKDPLEFLNRSEVPYIALTNSFKPILEFLPAEKYVNFTIADHKDAQGAHMVLASKTSGDVSKYHLKKSNDHAQISFEKESPLLKTAKDYKSMLGNVQEHPEAFAAAKKMPNSNWGQWVVKNYKTEGKQKLGEMKDHLEHFAGSQHIPEVAAVRFGKEHDFDKGLAHLEAAESAYNDRTKSKVNIVKPTKRTTKLLDVGKGRAWQSLNAASCKEDGEASAHCGNVGSEREGQNALSLRTDHNLKGKIYHEPHLFFVNDTNSNALGQMKGRANEKPHKKYHKDIAALLSQGYIPVGGGYKPETNFHIDDLDSEHRSQVLNSNPKAFIMSGDKQLSQNAMASIMDDTKESFSPVAKDANTPSSTIGRTRE